MRANYLSKQDIKITLHYLGYIMAGIGLILVLPIIIDLIYGELIYLKGLIPPIASILLGYIFVSKFKKYDKLRFKLECSFQVFHGCGQDL